MIYTEFVMHFVPSARAPDQDLPGLTTQQRPRCLSVLPSEAHSEGL